MASDLTRDLQLGRAVQKARRALLYRMSNEEQKTRRATGSAPAKTFEDTAREIAAGAGPRAEEIGKALANFQAAVNALWVCAIESEVPETHTKRWVDLNGTGYLDLGVTFDDALSEANFCLRHCITRYDPDKKEVTLAAYAGKAIFRALSLWVTRLQAPVEIAEKAARGTDVPTRASDEDYQEITGESPHEDDNV